MLERSQAILERSLAMESTLLRLVEGQEELRRMMAMANGSDVPEMMPAAFVKREEGDEVDNIELSSTTPASPLRVTEAVENAEEEDDISSVSSVSTDEDVDYMDLSSAHVLEGEEKNPPGRPTRSVPVPHSVTGSLSPEQEGTEKSEEEDDGASSMSSEHEASTSGEETELDDEDTARKGSPNTSAPNRYNSEALAVWKCAVCGKLIKGDWPKRQHHIESHEELKLRCPLTGCSARKSNHHFVSHLRVAHKTAKSSLPVEQRAELQRQLDEINQKAMECEMTYFPPSSLVSFAKTSGSISVNPACKKCDKL
uniref:C2H2-type domain-containing protein n=1 Tax=Steinernema glaseri TaxID=37863 RepID=A0A1I7YEW2_9BILA